MNWLTGFHAVEEALASGRPLDRILIARGRHGDRPEEVFRLAKSRGIPVRFEERQQLDRLTGTREHQGIAALAAAKPAVELEDLLASKTPAGLIVLLDGIEDPHNLGAIVRTSLAAGANGVVIPERRAAARPESVLVEKYVHGFRDRAVGASGMTMVGYFAFEKKSRSFGPLSGLWRITPSQPAW